MLVKISIVTMSTTVRNTASFNPSFNASDITRDEVPTSKITIKIMTIIETIMVKSNNKNIEIKAKRKKNIQFSQRN